MFVCFGDNHIIYIYKYLCKCICIYIYIYVYIHMYNVGYRLVSLDPIVILFPKFIGYPVKGGGGPLL